jgi:hypothetical protein
MKPNCFSDKIFLERQKLMSLLNMAVSIIFANPAPTDIELV